MANHAFPYTQTKKRIIITVSRRPINLKQIKAKGDIRMPTMVIVISRGKTVRFINTIEKFFTAGI